MVKSVILSIQEDPLENLIQPNSVYYKKIKVDRKFKMRTFLKKE
jgi:hypothetical protein